MTFTDFIPRFSGLSLGTVRRSVKALFSESQIDSAAIDARLLLEHATGYSHSKLIAESQEIITPAAVAALNGYCQRRLRGEPVDKILGFKAFHNYTFKVTQDVLSPRPETEGLVESALDSLKDIPSPRILDLGTGSGAILITLLSELKHAVGVGTDISPKALLIAEQNAALNGVASRASFLLGSWFEALASSESTIFDAVVSNPPYITDVALTALGVGVLNYDPDIALRGGQDGLDSYRLIIRSAQDYLRPDGNLVLEIGFDQGQSVSKLLENAGYRHIRLEKDEAGHDRILRGVRP